MTWDGRAIMRHAHATRRRYPGIAWSACLRLAWARAKGVKAHGLWSDRRDEGLLAPPVLLSQPRFLHLFDFR